MVPQRLRYYSSSGWGLLMAGPLWALLFLLPVWVVAKRYDLSFAVVPLIVFGFLSFGVLGQISHSCRYTFDESTCTLSIQPLVFFIRYGREEVIPLSHVTGVKYEERSEEGWVTVEVENRWRFTVAGSYGRGPGSDYSKIAGLIDRCRSRSAAP